MKGELVVSFSGGKTSAYMCWYLLTNWSEYFNFTFCFANTGLEHEETLKFVKACDEYFGLNLVWLEAVVNPEHGKGIRHRRVTFETASRNGEPFEAHISKSGIPNANKPQCSDRLKACVIEHYKKVNGLRRVPHCIGIRKDEERRKSAGQSSKYNLVYPLCDWCEVDKQDVNTFWDNMPFTLNLDEHQGNCKTCWKKSDKKLWLIAVEEPESYDFMKEMEEKYEQIKPNDNGVRRVFFRRNRSTTDVIKESEGMSASALRKMIGYFPDEGDGCTESCEAYGIS